MTGKHKLGGWVFFALVLLAYSVTALLEPAIAQQSVVSFLSVLGKVAPLLILVLALMFLVERYLSIERTRHWLGSGSGLRGWLLALLGGVLSTGPVYAWYGLLAELRTKGMRPEFVAVLLYARAIKLPLIPLLVHYFGLRYAVVLSLSIAAFSLINGFAMGRVASLREAE